MKSARRDIRTVRIYIDEWMAVRDIPNQKALAQRMQRAEGTISKKLKSPGKIDLQWLSEFAAALRISAIDLFRDPAELPLIPPETGSKLEKLMKAASLLEEERLDYLISFLSGGQNVRPLEGQHPEDAPVPSSTVR